MEVDKGDVFDSSAQALLDMARSGKAWPYADHNTDAEKHVHHWTELYLWFYSDICLILHLLQTCSCVNFG